MTDEQELAPPPSDPRGAIQGKMGSAHPSPSSDLLPEIIEPVEALAKPQPDALPLQACDHVLQCIDRGTDHVILEITELQDELDRLKQQVLDDAGICKEQITRHFSLQAEATATTDKIRVRMRYLATT